MTLFISSCPLANCRWSSDPLKNEDQTNEALRKHISDHAHADLVIHIHSIEKAVSRYELSPQ